MTNNFDILDKLLISFGITNSRLEKVNFICILSTFYKDVCYLFVIETFQLFKFNYADVSEIGISLLDFKNCQSASKAISYLKTLQHYQ